MYGMMTNKKLFILKPDVKEGFKDPFPNYDVTLGFIIRATSEEEARRFASQNQGDEGWGEWQSPWLDENLTSCEELLAEGESGVIMRDFNNG